MVIYSFKIYSEDGQRNSEHPRLELSSKYIVLLPMFTIFIGIRLEMDTKTVSMKVLETVHLSSTWNLFPTRVQTGGEDVGGDSSL